MPTNKTARGVRSSKPDDKKRTPAEKKQDHIDEVTQSITQILPSIIEESIQNSVDDYATRNDPDAKHKDLIEKFRDLIPQPTFDDLWTEQDEEDLEQEADRDAELQHRCTYQDYVTSVWKTAYKFMGCLATDIVGPKSHLRFHSDHITSKNRFWASPFCQKLSALIVQPIFQGKAGKLALAIQWTVICRTKDRRKWRLSGCGSDDPFLHILRPMVQQYQDGTKTPKKLRRMALEVYKSRHPTEGFQDPLWCQFLQRIEEQAPKTKSPWEPEEDSQDFGEFLLYRVNTTDLNNLMEAIAAVRMSGYPMFPDPATLAMTALYTRNPSDLPMKPQVIEATKAALLAHRREAKRAEKSGRLDDSSPVGLSKTGGTQGAAEDEHGSSLASNALSGKEIAAAEAVASGEEAEEADEAEAAEEEEAPRRGTRTRRTRKTSTPVLLMSDDEEEDSDEFSFTSPSPKPAKPSRAQKQPKSQTMQFFIPIPRRSTSTSQARDGSTAPAEGAEVTQNAMQDDDGFQDFADVELGESVHGSVDQSNSGYPLKRTAETQPGELSDRASKRRRFDDLLIEVSQEPGGSSRSVVDDSDPGQEQQQEQDSNRFLTDAPYPRTRFGYATTCVFPNVATNLGLEDALRQIFGERPAEGGSKQQPEPAGEASVEPRQGQDAQPGVAAPTIAEPSTEAQQSGPDQTEGTSNQPDGNNDKDAETVKPQIHKKVKRSMLNQPDWLWENGSNPSRRNPMDAWQLLTK